MAINSQGAKIRIQATAAGATAVTNSGAATAMDFDKDNSCINWHDAAADFSAAGFTTAMRVWHSASVNQYGYTVETVDTTHLKILGSMSSSTGLSFVVHGAKMTEIGAITNFSVPTGSAPIIDITNLGSTAKEKLVGLPDEGQMSFEFNVESTDHIQWTHLKAYRLARTQKTFDVCFSDATKISASGVPSQALLQGYVTGFSVNAAVDNAVKGNVTVEIDGPVLWSTVFAS